MLNQPKNNQHSRTALYNSHSMGARLTLTASIIILITAVIGYLVLDADTASAQSTVASAHSSQVAVVRSGGAKLLDTPNSTSQVTLPVGTALTALGRSADSRWLYAESEIHDAVWVNADQILVIDVERLPIMAIDMPAVETSEETTESAVAESAIGQSAEAESQTEPGVNIETSNASTTTSTSAQEPGDNALDEQVVATVTTKASHLNVRSGPGINYPILDQARSGDSFVVIASNRGSSWYQIEWPDAPGEVAWVSARFVSLDDTILKLAFSDATGSAPLVANPLPITSTESTPPQVSVSTLSSTGLNGNLIFQSGNGGPIYVYNLNSGHLRTLTTGHDPAISPDGQTVAFTRYGNEYGLYLIELDGSNERLIFAEKESIGAPSWSPDGQWILFSHQTGEFGCRELFPGICFKHYRFLSDFPLKEKPEWGLSKVDRNGDNFRDLPALNTAYAADWTDAGIVYQASTSIEITHDTSEYEGWAVMNQKVGHEDPDWQPGGGRILFQDRGVNHTEIWSANPDGSGLVALTGPVTTLVDQMPSNVSPAWSPDGQHIVYLSNRDAEEEAGAWRLWIMDADGGNKEPLPIDVAIEYHYGREQVVSWGR